MTRQNRKGFTLIEILIVVIILGILAAIVIPQFTNASKEAKHSSLVTQVQSMRSQIALFKLQHNDYLPGSAPLNGAFDGDVFWNQMTQFSDVTGAVSTAKSATHDKGPYMQSKPKNPLCPGTATEASTVAVAGVITDGVPADNAAIVGFIYDYGTNGNGSGKIWGTDTNGKSAIPQ